MYFSSKYATVTCLPHIMVTVITDPGVMEAEFDYNFVCNQCGKSEECYLHSSNACSYIRDTIERIDLKSWIHCVNGKIARIDG